MARKFIGEKEHRLISNINKELIQRWIGAEIIYYAISVEHSQVDDLYGESKELTHYTPVAMNGLVNYDNPGVSSNQFTLDAQYSLELYLHSQELAERNIQPVEGEYVEWNRIFFEISSVTRPQMVFGQPQHKIMTKLVCVPSREGLFKAGGRSATPDAVDNAHPVYDRRSRRLEEE
jgi:hypothetical protein